MLIFTGNTVPVYIQGASLARKYLLRKTFLFYSSPIHELFLLWLLDTALLMLGRFKDTSKLRLVEDTFEESVCLEAWLNHHQFHVPLPPPISKL